MKTLPLFSSLLVCVAVVTIAGCPHPRFEPEPDGEGEAAEGEIGEGEAGEGELGEGEAEGEGEGEGEEAFDIDLFGKAGHTFRFVVSEEQATQMENGDQGGFEDQYEIGGGTHTDDLIVTNVDSGESHAFGKVELKLVGQSTRRPWNRIPNLRVDTDEFQKGLKIGGVEHFRFNNGQVGGIYREAVAFQVWSAFGYPVPRASFAWVEAPTQWGPETRVPYTLVEVYKKSWCDHAIEGGCANIWETQGDVSNLAGACQSGECDDTRVLELASRLGDKFPGPGFMASIDDILDWDAFHTFQCLSWITGTGDDYIHNNNNLVVVERDDGKLQFLPYSVDISAGQEWYPDVHLLGGSTLARGCQSDPECFAGLLSRCDAMITELENTDVVKDLVDPTIKLVHDADMERARDTARAAALRTWYRERAATLRADPVWTAVPCSQESDCAEREDGKTTCDFNQGICVEGGGGGGTCGIVPCPDGSFCDDRGNCIPFEPIPEPGPRPID